MRLLPANQTFPLMPELRPRDAKTGRFTSQDPKPGKDRIDKLMDTLVEVRNSMATTEDLAEVRADLGEVKSNMATSEGQKTLRSELRFEMEERNITLFNHMKTMEGNILRANTRLK